MTLIKCPQCGQTVLSVATTCPKCQHLLTQNPMQQGEHSDLIECRRCEKMIHENAEVCEYCGYPVELRRRMRRIAWSAAGVVAVAVIAVVAVQMQAESRAPEQAGAQQQTAPPPPMRESPADRAARVPPAAAETTAAVSPPPAPPEGRRAIPPRAPEVGASGADAGPALPAQAQTRWTNEWANLRSGRDTLSPILRAVAPGTALTVASPRNGWWSVYLDSAFAGYIAGDLLARDRPDTVSGRDSPR